MSTSSLHMLHIILHYMMIIMWSLSLFVLNNWIVFVFRIFHRWVKRKMMEAHFRCVFGCCCMNKFALFCLPLPFAVATVCCCCCYRSRTTSNNIFAKETGILNLEYFIMHLLFFLIVQFSFFNIRSHALTLFVSLSLSASLCVSVSLPLLIALDSQLTHFLRTYWMNNGVKGLLFPEEKYSNNFKWLSLNL